MIAARDSSTSIPGRLIRTSTCSRFLTAGSLVSSGGTIWNHSDGPLPSGSRSRSAAVAPGGKDSSGSHTET